MYNLSGGTATFGGITGNGIVNICGGTLTATTVNHSGVFHQTGGTFNSTTFTQTGTQYIDAAGNQRIGGAYHLMAGDANVTTFNNAGIIAVGNSGTLIATTINQIDSTYLDLNTGETKHFGVLYAAGSVSAFTISGNGTIIVDGSNASIWAYNLTAESLSIADGGQIGTTGVIDAGTLSMDSTAFIYLDDTAGLIVRGGMSLSEIQSLIEQGSTNGNGIIDFDAPAGASLYADTAGDLGITTFDGVAVNSSDIIVQSTDNTDSMAMISINPSAVPEPASLSVMAFGAVTLLKRRQR